MFFIGGYDKILHTDRASMECFDPDTQEWTLTAEMEKARSGLVLVALDHYIYAFGGRFRPTDQYFDLVERWVEKCGCQSLFATLALTFLDQHVCVCVCVCV